jgi:hypothetical protein
MVRTSSTIPNTDILSLNFQYPPWTLEPNIVYTDSTMHEFSPGFSPAKYVFHLLILLGLLSLFLGALINLKLIALFIAGVIIFVLLFDLYSLKQQRITIEDSNLSFTKISSFKKKVETINLRDVASFKLLVHRGQFDLVDRNSIRFSIAINKDEPKLYSEVQKTIDLSLWNNSRVQEFVTYLKNTYPTVIWK